MEKWFLPVNKENEHMVWSNIIFLCCENIVLRIVCILINITYKNLMF